MKNYQNQLFNRAYNTLPGKNLLQSSQRSSFRKLILSILILTAFMGSLVAQQITRSRLPQNITQQQIDAHEIRPVNIREITSTQEEEVKAPATINREALTRSRALRTPAPTTTNQFNNQKFTNDLHERLKDNVVGYAMQLRRNGQPVQTLIWGYARTPLDGNVGWTLDTRMHVASVSKMITGIAMYKILLENTGIGLNSKIIDYLPAYWTKGPGIDQITFQDLLNHTSGLTTGDSSSDYETMKNVIARGTTSRGTRRYANMNFGLCRILIPVINKDVDKNANFGGINDVTWDFLTIMAYRNYVQQKILTPAGVAAASFTPNSNSDALAYLFPHNNRNGWNSGNLNSMSGGACWRLSVNEVLQVMDHFRRKGTIMSQERAQYVLDQLLGLDRAMNSPQGTFYDKNGRWHNSARGAEQSVAMFLPNNYELVVFVNSQIGNDSKWVREVVTETYLASFN